MARVNRKLGRPPQLQALRKARSAGAKSAAGAYYIVSINGGVWRADVDLVEFARSIGALASYEVLRG